MVGMFLKEEDLKEERGFQHRSLRNKGVAKKKTTFVPLRKKKEISEIFERGKSYYAENIVLLYLQTKHEKQIDNKCRAVIIASKKVGKAFQRNRAKRIIREALRKIISNKLLSCDIIIIAKNKIAGKKMQDIKKNLEEIIVKIK
ncbi:MAG: ribonuclease P protein component [Clostridiales Family XIII bacterium]|jgi:ribonuclease P protein component|nr:ribonuclease P protein component [Clostridiales Family XIII bacterium]